MSPLRVFLDANVLFSTSNSTGNIPRLIDWLVREGSAVTSDLAREEARRNLALKRPGWLPAFSALVERIEIVPTVRFPLPATLPASDLPLLCSAVRVGCTHFATGDRRDFGHLFGETIDGVQVIHLLRLAELLAQRRRE